MPTLYDQFLAHYAIRRTLRDSAELPAQPDPTSVRIAREIVACSMIAPPMTEAMRRRFDEEMRLAELELTAEEREIIAAFDESVGIGFSVPRR
jgi:hypothetical protein